MSSDAVTLCVPSPTMVPQLSFHHEKILRLQAVAVEELLWQGSAETIHCVFYVFEQVHLLLDQTSNYRESSSLRNPMHMGHLDKTENVKYYNTKMTDAVWLLTKQ